MTNLGYLVAAYAITLGALAVYAVLLCSHLRRAERDLAAMTGGEGEQYGH